MKGIIFNLFDKFFSKDFEKDTHKDINTETPIIKQEQKYNVTPIANDIQKDKESFNFSVLNDLDSTVQEKGIDWNLMQFLQNSTSDTGFFRQEYNIFVDKTVLKNVYANESNVYKSVNFIANQFLSTRFQIKQRIGSGNEKIIDKHPLLNLLNNPKDEARSVFYSTGIVDLLSTGEFYFYYNKEEQKLVRFQSEKIRISNQPKNQDDIEYVVSNWVDGKQISEKYNAQQLMQIKLPNPYYKFSGLSAFVAAILPILTDKYSKEYIVGFFLRGGQLPLILESDTNAIDTLIRIFKSLQHAFAGRRNQHSDKILPKGLTYKGEGSTFKNLQILDLLKFNQRDVLGHLGVPPAIVGDTDGVNYANSLEQMKGFWKNKILPLQKHICSSIEQSYLYKVYNLDSSIYELIFDNSQNEYLSLMGEHIEQNIQLQNILTVNELRSRIGYPNLKSIDGDVLLNPPKPSIDNNQTKVDELPILDSNNFKKITEEHKSISHFKKVQKIPKQIKSLFLNEFKEWEKIVLDHVNNKKEATSKIHTRAKSFSEKFSADMRQYAVKLYDIQINHVLNQKSNFEMLTKEQQQDRRARLEFLKHRAANVMEGDIFDRSKNKFLNYSDTQMDRVYNLINELLNDEENPQSLDMIASDIRMKFGEFYKGQANTIIRTEFLSSQSMAFPQFESDLKTVASKMVKTWMSLNDNRTREDHKDVNNEQIEYTNEDDENDSTFSIGLKYPRDPAGDADEVINCRCTMTTKVLDWQN